MGPLLYRTSRYNTVLKGNGKMKIGIITHHDVHNHGAQLQLYALVEVFRSLGHDAKALTYTKNYDFLSEEARVKYDVTARSIPYYASYLVRNGLAKTFYNVRKRSILKQFRASNRLVDGYYSEQSGLDCVFVGSDEVFSIETGLNTFFWGMGVPTSKVFAYAGSFGPTDLGDIEKRYAIEFVRAGIERLTEISVRDQNSHDIIFRLTGKDVPIVCDPVILYDYNKEVKDFKRPIDERYLVVYSYDNNMNEVYEVEQIVAFARRHHLKVISAGFYHRWCDRNENVTPLELINYIKHAECVITDTFHGAVISIVMNTPFIVRIRGNRNKLGYLMEEYGLSERCTEDFSDLDRKLQENINFDRVNRLVDERRALSHAYIQRCLRMVTGE